jgi:methyltransferase
MIAAFMIEPVLLAAIFVPMVIEAAIARRHERRQLARGGIEPHNDVYRLMRICYPGLMLLMIVEGGLRVAAVDRLSEVGLAVFGASKALKWWAMTSLGDFWTFRVIVLPGASLIASGPYRFLRHPNYLAVIGEFVGVALMTGAILTGPIAIVLFGVLILKRIQVEEKALGLMRGSRL